MKRIHFLLPGVLMLLLLLGCSKGDVCDCFKSGGSETEEIRVTDVFSRLDIRDNVDVCIFQDTACSVRVVCGSDLISGVITQCFNNQLVIRNTNQCNWIRNNSNPVTVYVGLPELTELIYNGFGNVACLDTLRMHEIRMDVTDGSGTINMILKNTSTRLNIHEGVVDVHLRGKSGVSYIFNNGIAPMDALNLTTDICFITSKSVGNSIINVRDTIEARIDYQGNILYKGNPFLKNTILNSSGLLLPY